MTANEPRRPKDAAREAEPKTASGVGSSDLGVQLSDYHILIFFLHGLPISSNISPVSRIPRTQIMSAPSGRPINLATSCAKKPPKSPEREQPPAAPETNKRQMKSGVRMDAYAKVSGGSQLPMTFDSSLSEWSGSGSLDRL